MAIIYSYPSEGVITGTEEVLVTIPGEENALRTISIQQISNLNPTSSGVSRVLFNDDVGLSPTVTEGGADPNAGTGVVIFSGLVSHKGGGTGLGQAEMTAANAGDVLIINSTNDGYVYSAPPSGETYTFSTIQNTTTAANVDLTLTSSGGAVQTVTLVPGSSGNVTLTANETANPRTITIESTGSGTTYQAGDGININTTTTPNSLEAKIGSGLAFNASSQIQTNIGPTNLADTPSSGFTNGDILQYNGNTANNLEWISFPGIRSATKTQVPMCLWYENSSGNREKHSDLTYVAQGAINYVIGTFGVFKFYQTFSIDTSSSTLVNPPSGSAKHYLILGDANDATNMLPVREDNICTGGIVNIASCTRLDSGTPIQVNNNWRTMPEVLTLFDGDGDNPYFFPELENPAQWKGCVFVGQREVLSGGTQTNYTAPTSWCTWNNNTDLFTLSGTITYMTVDNP